MLLRASSNHAHSAEKKRHSACPQVCCSDSTAQRQKRSFPAPAYLPCSSGCVALSEPCCGTNTSATHSCATYAVMRRPWASCSPRAVKTATQQPHAGVARRQRAVLFLHLPTHTSGRAAQAGLILRICTPAPLPLLPADGAHRLHRCSGLPLYGCPDIQR